MRFATPAVMVLLLAPVAAADWPSFHGDSWNTGYLANSQYEVYKEVWWNNVTPADAQMRASPVLKDGILIVADLKGLVRALDAESGKELWRQTFKKPIEGTPAIQGERVYVVDTGGDLKALNLRRGQIEHATSVGGTLGHVAVHEGKVFIGTEAGQVKAYLADTLTLLWTFSLNDVGETAELRSGRWSCSDKHTNQPVRSKPVVYGGRVFFGSMNHWVYAIDEQGLGTGKTEIRWAYKTEDVIVGSPVVDSQRSRVLFGSYDGKLYAFPTAGGAMNPCNGDNRTVTPHWTYEVPSFVNDLGQAQISKIHSSPALDGNQVYFGANNGKAYAIRADNGQRVWEQTVGSPIEPVTPSPAVANGTVVLGSENKNVYWLRAADGNISRRFATEAAVKTSAAIDGNRAYIASQDGTVYMFGPNLPARPDLVVAGIEYDGSAVVVGVGNRGDGEAGATTVRIFRGGTFLANLNVTPLPAGNLTLVLHTMSLGEGSHELRAEVDPDRLVTESDEANNGLVQTVRIRPPPDEEQPTPTKKKKEGGVEIPVPGAAAALLLLLLVARRRR